MGGRSIAPMYGGRGNVGDWCTAPLCGRGNNVCGGATAPMCGHWTNLAGHYGWGQLANDSLHDCAWAACHIVGD